MTFFMEKKESSKSSLAVNKLLRNLLLLLHILFVLGAAAAIAQPLAPGFDQPEEAVLIMDVSASMEPELDEAKEFAKDRVGESNALIIVSDRARVIEEDAPPSAVRSEIDDLEAKHVETDIVSGLRAAQDYDGEVIVASDLVQSVDDRDVESAVDELRSERNVELYEASQLNELGIVDVEAGVQNSSVEIRNFKDEPVTTPVEIDDRGISVEIEPRSTERITFEVSSGKNVVELEGDRFTADDRAYISVPEEEQFDVGFIADEENRYFREAINLISFTDYHYIEPTTEQELDHDVYVVGESSRMLESTIAEIERQVSEEGVSMVLFSNNDITRFNSIDGTLGDWRNSSVEIERPVRTGFATQVRTGQPGGESLSDPSEALTLHEHGDGEILLYNIKDEDFRYKFMYPVFWKNMIAEMTGRPTVDQLNRRTGDELHGSEIQRPDGETVEEVSSLDRAGFYETSSGVYAANLMSPDESDDEPLNLESSQIDEDGDDRGNVQHLAALLLALLVLSELAYLVYTGEL